MYLLMSGICVAMLTMLGLIAMLFGYTPVESILIAIGAGIVSVVIATLSVIIEIKFTE